GESPLMTALMRLEQAPPSPRARATDIDERWERIILKCMAREADARPGSAREVYLALSSTRAIAQTEPPWAASSHPAPRRPIWPFGVAAAGLLGGVGVVLWPRTPPPAARALAHSAVAQLAAAPAPPALPASPTSIEKKSAIILRSDPKGAVVLVDDQPVATTP